MLIVLVLILLHRAPWWYVSSVRVIPIITWQCRVAAGSLRGGKAWSRLGLTDNPVVHTPGASGRREGGGAACECQINPRDSATTLESARIGYAGVG